MHPRLLAGYLLLHCHDTFNFTPKRDLIIFEGDGNYNLTKATKIFQEEITGMKIKQAFETDSAASCCIFNPCLGRIIRSTSFSALCF